MPSLLDFVAQRMTMKRSLFYKKKEELIMNLADIERKLKGVRYRCPGRPPHGFYSVYEGCVSVDVSFHRNCYGLPTHLLCVGVFKSFNISGKEKTGRGRCF